MSTLPWEYNRRYAISAYAFLTHLLMQKARCHVFLIIESADIEERTPCVDQLIRWEVFFLNEFGQLWYHLAHNEITSEQVTMSTPV